MNWTKFPNDVLEKLARAPLPKGHFKIFLAVLRETVGFGRDSASLSLTRLAKLTWLRRDKVSEALAGMKAFRILEITPANGRRAAEIRIAPVASWTVPDLGTVPNPGTVPNSGTIKPQIGDHKTLNREPCSVELKKAFKESLKERGNGVKKEPPQGLRVPDVEETRRLTERMGK